uniref:Uncharacterized protein n=1 Tax=Anguilla anguilla TaxID=7936 RepID=A0A0E9XC43_ANGAN
MPRKWEGSFPRTISPIKASLNTERKDATC